MPEQIFIEGHQKYKRYDQIQKNGKWYRLLERDEYPFGTPGWWAVEVKERGNTGNESEWTIEVAGHSVDLIKARTGAEAIGMFKEKPVWKKLKATGKCTEGDVDAFETFKNRETDRRRAQAVDGALAYGSVGNESEFDVKINRRLTPQESDGKWDFEVTVTRKSDGKSRSLKGSGGEPLVDSIVSRLKKELS